ncbi:MAG: NAD-dependent epimerase/dehydratase family protein [Polyangiaceae bacterium]|nr:NAD-dependent epimerase/dehydratase family protein [Polyangiaceae bacterium]
MHVLLIGGTRFIGPLLAFRLLAAGHRLTVLNRGTQPDPFGAFLPRIEGLVADRRSADFAKVLTGRSFDAVVDFAAYEAEDVRGAVHTLADRTDHYIFVSTGQVYLVRENCPRPARETDYLGPLLPRPQSEPDLGQWDYGMGKRACEDALIEAWETRRFPSTRVRIPMVNGERDDKRRMEGYLFRILDGGPVILPDGGTIPTRHVYAGEVVRAITAMLGRRDTFGEAFNVTQDETPTLSELIQILAEFVGARPTLVNVSSQAIEDAGLSVTALSRFTTRWMSFLDPAKIKAQLNFNHVPLREYLGHMVASFLAHPPVEPPREYAQRPAEIALAEAILRR